MEQPKRRVGRPVEYTPNHLEKAKEYLSKCEDTERIIETKSGGFIKLNVDLPSLVGLADYLDIARATVYEWQDTYDEFSDICDKVLQEQYKRLTNNGLAGTYNPTIAKLLLTKHGLSDKVEADLSTKGKPLQTNLNIDLSKFTHEQLSQLIKGAEESPGSADKTTGSEGTT